MATSTDALRYVIQRHDASFVHYDLRLEHDGVAKSWALRKEPNDTDKRLATPVADHSIDYMSFEGTIPEGYGAGTVEIWDSGTYTVRSWKADKIVVAIDGKRLKGEYVLVKMKGWKVVESKKGWLFFRKR